MSRASGLVLEIGLGTGLNLRHYTTAVNHLCAVEPDPHMRRRCAARISVAAVSVELCGASAEALPYDDGRFDDVVCTFTLCTIPDPVAALAEARRVLRPGGRLLFSEHVASRGGAVRCVQGAVEPVWRRLAGGCHLTRSATILIEEAGFALEECERRGARGSLMPLVWGVARR